MKTLVNFMTKESTLKVMVVLLAIVALGYIEQMEWNKTTAQVTNAMIQVIQSDNSGF